MGQQRERRLISEWALARYPRDRRILGCPIGEVRTELVSRVGQARAVRLSRPWRLEVDAVIPTADRLVVAEAKIFRPRDGIGDLLVYRAQVWKTPELQQYRDLDLDLVLVSPWESDFILELCRDGGIRLEVYGPPWVADYIEEHHKYWTPEYQAARAEKRRLREVLGVE